MANDLYAACGWSASSLDDDSTILTTDRGNINIYLPAAYVPRDAPLGSIIGTARVNDNWRWGDTKMFCTSKSASNFTATSLTGIVTGITMPGGSPQRLGPILKTNIPGVGVVIETETFGGSWSKSGSYPYIPYQLTVTTPGATPIWGTFDVYVSLVKIGDIPVGKTSFSDLKIVSFAGNRGTLWSYRLNGSVTRAECSVPQSAKMINVNMGSVQRGEFNGKDSFLDAHDFQIPITDCTDGTTYPTNQSWNFYTTPSVNIRIDGLSGSNIIDPEQGILGLSQGSTASGLGVQILHKGGTPVGLGRDVPMSILGQGATSTTLSFQARYIQTSENAGGPSPGSADAKAAFTITYK